MSAEDRTSQTAVITARGNYWFGTGPFTMPLDYNCLCLVGYIHHISLIKPLHYQDTRMCNIFPTPH